MITHIVQFAEIENFSEFKSITKEFYSDMIKNNIIFSYAVHRSLIHKNDADLGLGLAGENHAVLVVQFNSKQQQDLYVPSEQHQQYVAALIENKFLCYERLTETVRVVDYYHD